MKFPESVAFPQSAYVANETIVWAQIQIPAVP